MPGRNTLPCQGHGNVIINKQFTTETPGIVDGILHTGVAFSGAVTQPDQYVGRAPNVVADFLDGFFGNGGNTLIRRRTEGLQKQVVPYVKQELARSEEHTSELQSLMRISYAVFCLKIKKQKTHSYDRTIKHH